MGRGWRYRHGLCCNVRAGAADIVEYRKKMPTRFRRLFPRTAFHLIYLRRFGLRRYLFTGCPLREFDEAMEALRNEHRFHVETLRSAGLDRL